MSSYFNQGISTNRVAFVLSAPGKAEQEKPASGNTGTNMNDILGYLNKLDSKIFPEIDRYCYLITNACTRTMYKLQDGKTECGDNEVLESSNIDRIIAELKNHSIVILCGAKSHLLKIYLKDKTVVETNHLGDKGLRNKYKKQHPNLKGITKNHRDSKRKELCAEDIFNKLKNKIS